MCNRKISFGGKFFRRLLHFDQVKLAAADGLECKALLEHSGPLR